MAEIKKVFTAGRMNKSLDERLVPNGEYRDAMNIQVRTTDDNAAGTIQNLQGNKAIHTPSFDSASTMKAIGVVADEKNNKSYYLLASPTFPEIISNGSIVTSIFSSKRNWVDAIVEVDSNSISSNVVVDNFAITETLTGGVASSHFWSSLTISNATTQGYRVGMTLQIYQSDGTKILADNTKVVSVSGSTVKLSTRTSSALLNSIIAEDVALSGGTTFAISNAQATNISVGSIVTGTGVTAGTTVSNIGAADSAPGNGEALITVNQTLPSNDDDTDLTITPAAGINYYFVWQHPKALNFKQDTIITGINVIDEYLFFTDNLSEPKKINIRRCKAGTTGNNHTKLLLDNQTGSGLQNLSFFDATITSSDNYYEGDLLEEHITVIKEAPRAAPTLLMSDTFTGGANEFIIDGINFVQYSAGNLINIGDQVIIFHPGNGFELLVGDIYLLTANNDTAAPDSIVRIRINEIDSVYGHVSVTVLSRSADVQASHTNWTANIINPDKTLFELKFVRFGYRYKYNDDEYSSFSPFSEIAFLPGEFNYTPKKGFNLGMVNKLKDLRITNLIADKRIRPDEIKAIDILYKTTDSPLVYVAKTINRDFDPEFPTITNSNSEVRITSDMIHRTVPDQQILRSWDNVPIVAKAQEIVGNRLIYANYVQGYDVGYSVGVDQAIISNKITNNIGTKSIKSLRSYKFGLVIGDKYGRETPVISVGNRTFTTNNAGSIDNNDDTLVVKKINSVNSNKFVVKQNWSNASIDTSWMDYVKYYVKETSSEYYNLILDRWYDAQDGNIWLSFPSADRNKVDENSYLVLKKEHADDLFVPEDARYKIISIANEAPDFIKSDNRTSNSFPVAGAFSNTDYVTVDGVPTPEPLMTNTNFELSQNLYDNINRFKGTPKVKIEATAEDESGNEVYQIVTSYRTVTSINNNEFNIQVPFGDEINVVQAFVDAGIGYENTTQATQNTNGVLAIKYTFKFKDEVSVNKPEFDGRFFVKIERDNILEQKVLKTLHSSFLYSTEATLYCGYISTTPTNPAINNANSSYTWNGFGITGLINNSTNIFADNTTDGVTKTMQYWEEYTNQAIEPIFIDGADAAGFFQDNANGYEEDNDDNAFTTSGASRGFAKSGDIDVQNYTFDRLFFSIYPSSTQQSANTFDAGSFGYQFKEKMTSIGTLFRFINDPNKNRIYKIVEGKGEVDHVSNFFTDSNISNSNIPSLDSDGLVDNSNAQTRQSFYTTFRRVNSSGQLTNEGINVQDWDPRGVVKHDGMSSLGIQIVKKIDLYDGELPVSSNGAAFETEPKESVDLDIYYEASNCIPMVLNDKNTVEFAPINSTVNIFNATTGEERDISNAPLKVSAVYDSIVYIVDSTNAAVTDTDILKENKATGYEGDVIVFTHSDGTKTRSNITRFIKNNISTDGYISSNGSSAVGYFEINKNVYKNKVELPWFNCYSFGNGVESDRIRDDFNAPQIDNGVNASSSLLDYKREHRYNGLIYSEIFNPNADVNGLNEFNVSQKITKDLNPDYGEIQALKTRDTDIIAFAEDKVLRILANKDALFNADGNTNITSTDRVLGQAVPYVGDYGISKNPESLASDQYRLYFTDKQRGAVLRLSRDGLTPISNIGMRTYFRDNLYKTKNAIGSFDTVNGEYNLSIIYEDSYTTEDTTIAFNESDKGWVSFRSFVTDMAASVSGKYFSSKNHKIYEHHRDDVNRNTFYDTFADSYVSVVFNDLPGSIKNFKTINYEGSTGYQLSINSSNYSDGDFSAVTTTVTDNAIIEGWKVDSITTDLQTGKVIDFSEKEGKWFGNIVGDFNISNPTSEISEQSTQGLGAADSITLNDDVLTTGFNLTLGGG